MKCEMSKLNLSFKHKGDVSVWTSLQHCFFQWRQNRAVFNGQRTVPGNLIQVEISFVLCALNCLNQNSDLLFCRGGLGTIRRRPFASKAGTLWTRIFLSKHRYLCSLWPGKVAFIGPRNDFISHSRRLPGRSTRWRNNWGPSSSSVLTIIWS